MQLIIHMINGVALTIALLTIVFSIYRIKKNKKDLIEYRENRSARINNFYKSKTKHMQNNGEIK